MGSWSQTGRCYVNIIAYSSGGRETVNPELYDGFLVYGLKARPNFADPDRVISDQLQKALIEDLTRGSVSLKVLNQLKKLTDKPIYVGHAPLLAADSVLHREAPDAYVKGIAQLNSGFYAALRCRFVGQPLSTIVNSDRTDLKYSKGSQRLHTGILDEGEVHPEEDNEHMNDDYGALWMREFLDSYLTSPEISVNAI